MVTEPNEMKRFEFWRNVNGGLESSVDEDGHWVRYSDAMQIITALQEKIDGMIERPNGDLMQWNVDTAEDGTVESVESDLQNYDGLKVGAIMEYDQAINIGPLFVVVTKTPNGECECDEPCHCDEYDYEEFPTREQAQERATALGMDDSKEGGEG